MKSSQETKDSAPAETSEAFSEPTETIETRLAWAAEEGAGKPAAERFVLVRPLWCPFCGKPHVDRGEWAKRPHHKHLCHDDEHGKGCGGLFRIGEKGSSEYAFGAERFTRERISDGNLAVTFDNAREKWLDAARENDPAERERLTISADEDFLRLRMAVLGFGVPR